MSTFKILSSCFLVSVISLLSYGQIDSLQNILASSNNDSLKISACFKLYSEYSLNNPEKARVYIDQAYDLAMSSGSEKAIVLCYDKWGGLEMMNSNYTLAIDYYVKADSLLKDIDWPRQQAVIYGNLSGIYKDMAQFDEALKWNERFTELAEELDNPVFIGYGKALSGDIYNLQGHFNMSSKLHLEALRKYEEASDSSRIGDACLKIGEAHMYADRYEDAEEYLKKADQIYERVNDLYFRSSALNDLGYLEIQRENFSKAEFYYTQVDSLAEVLNSDYVRSQALDGRIDVALGLKEYQKVLKLCEKALILHKTLNDIHRYGWGLVNKAKALKGLGNLDQALENVKEAETVFMEFGLNPGIRATHQQFYLLKKAQGNFEESLTSLEKYLELNDSLFNDKTQTQIEELQIIYDTEKREQQLELIKKENELLKSKSEIEGLRKQRMWWLIAGLCMLAFVVIFWQFQSSAKNKKIAEAKAQRQEAELEAQKLEKQQLERELASHVLQLCQQNELLSSVKDKVSLLTPEADEKSHNELKSIERELNFNLQNKESWAQFLNTFEKVHPDFLTRLILKAEKLSPAEKRLACLLKMNLSSKQMASILCISPEGIKKARYRLRKKLKIESEVNLIEFLSVA